MSKLIVTSDRHNLDTEQYSFFIFDLETNKIVHKTPYTKLLDANILINAGRKPFRPFGIAQSEDHIFIASNSNIARFDNKTLEPIDLVSDTGVINTHQIAYYQGYLYRTNTSNDTITRIDLNTLEEIHFSFKAMSIVDKIDKPSNHSEYDNYHINSLLVYEDHIYVMAHNLGKRESELYRLTLDFKEIHHISNLETHHHEIIIDNGFMYSLATGTGNLIKLDLNTLDQEKYFLAARPNSPDRPVRLNLGNWHQDKHFLSAGMFLRGMVLIDNKLEIFGSQSLTPKPIQSDDYVTRITFDINDCSITKTSIDDLAVVTCVQEYTGV
jgi:hypothetical protein